MERRGRKASRMAIQQHAPGSGEGQLDGEQNSMVEEGAGFAELPRSPARHGSAS